MDFLLRYTRCQATSLTEATNDADAHLDLTYPGDQPEGLSLAYRRLIIDQTS